MVAAIEISPAAAAQAGCSATVVQVASGTFPLPDESLSPNDSESGPWTQYRYDVDAAGFWHAMSIEVTIKSTTRMQTPRTGYDNTTVATRTVTISPDDVPGDFDFDAATDELHYPFAEYAWHKESTDEGESSPWLIYDVTKEITSVKAVFVRILPHGPILCNLTGVMICNGDGDLLYN